MVVVVLRIASSPDALDRRRYNPGAKFSKSRVWAKFQRQVPLFLEIPEYPYNTV